MNHTLSLRNKFFGISKHELEILRHCYILMEMIHPFNLTDYKLNHPDCCRKFIDKGYEFYDKAIYTFSLILKEILIHNGHDDLIPLLEEFADDLYPRITFAESPGYEEQCYYISLSSIDD